jgi:exo-1,4-beta-D-glucosaminidase
MSGPYEYVPPRYWYEDKQRGGAFGFATEISPGPAVPPIESLRAMLPASKLWPMNDHWSYHAGGGPFKDLNLYTEALTARYGAPKSAEDFAEKSQLVAYEGIRAMFEAYSRNKYNSTGVIQWMLNNAWPGVIWHLYDWYLRPGGGYFGAKIATEALHPMYAHDDGSIWVVSSQYQDARGLRLGVKVYDLDSRERFSHQVTLDAPADSAQRVAVPALPEVAPVSFLQLTLEDASGKRVGSNFYWLSSRPDVLDYTKAKWYVTPTTSHADFTALARLPEKRLTVGSRTARQGEQAITTVTLENPGPGIAFFVRLKLTKGAGGEEILPVRWQDNYVSLAPGEKRELTATYRAAALGGAKAVVEARAFNAASASTPPALSRGTVKTR